MTTNDDAFTGTELATIAAPGHGMLDFDQARRYANVLAKSGLVPKALEGKPEAVMLVGLLGQELGVPFIQALSEVHVIEGRPSPSAQLRLSLIRRHGHEARFTDVSDQHAVIRGRRKENRRDPEAWVTVTYTIEDARRAGLLDLWVEDWRTPPGGDRKKKMKVKLGDDRGIDDALVAAAPDWAKKLYESGHLQAKDNWQKHPQEMLRARAASALCRMEFGDVLLGLNVDDFTPDEHGIDVELDVEPSAPTVDDAPDDDIEDADVVGEERLVDDAWVTGYRTTFEDLGFDEDQAEALVHTATRGRSRRLADLRMSEVPELRRWVRSVRSGEYAFIDMDGAAVVAPRSPEGDTDNGGQLPLDDEPAA